MSTDIPGFGSSIQTPDFVAARVGLVNGRAARSYPIAGRRNLGWSSTTVYGDVSNYLDTTQPRNNAVVLGTEYFIRSSSINDTNTGPGTGAAQVRVVYLDAAGAMQTMTAIMAGTTGVSLGSAIAYVLWAEVAAVGTNTAAVGNITISTVAGAPTTAQTVEYIQANENKSRSGRFKVPTGYTGYLHTWDASAIGNTMDLSVRATVFADDRALSTVFHSQDGIFLPNNSSAGPLLLHYMACPEGSEIKISAVPGATGAGNRADVTLHLLLVQNPA